MKKMMLVLMLALSAIPAFADLRVDLNGGERYLPECGGTIQATASHVGRGADDQINMVLRNVKSCSNFILQTTGREYKIPGPDGDRTGSFSLSAGNLDYGWNQVRLTVRSNSGAHRDDVSIWVQVVPTQPSGNPSSCIDEVKEASKDRFYKNHGYRTGPHVRFDRVSNKGNYVYEVAIGNDNYEVTTSTSCEVLSIQ